MNTPNFSERTVLVVDDEADVRSIVASAIELLGVRVLEAENGEQALAKYEAEVIDLVVLDVMMPDMPGTEVCSRLRTSEGGEALQILMLTARDSVDDKLEAFQLGADDYLTKPFDYKELQARAKALLRMRELNLTLLAQNQELERMQGEIAEKERLMTLSQVAGTAAHELGQPVSAILLNCHLLKQLDKSDPNFSKALSAVESDAGRITRIIEQLRQANPNETKEYHSKMKILDLKEE